MKRFLFLTALLLALVRVSFGDNTHGAPNDMKEMGAWLGDLTSPYIAASCLPTVPAASLTLGAFGCKGYVRGTTGELIYVDQDPVALTVPNTTGAFWLAISGDTTSTVSGWTRRAGTHYLFRQVFDKPPNPPQGQVFASVEVAGGVITKVTDFRLPRSMATSQTYDPLDPLYGAVGDGVTDDLAALQAWVNGSGNGLSCLTLPARTFLISGTLTFSRGGGCFQGSGHGPFSATIIKTNSPTAHMLQTDNQAVIIRNLSLHVATGVTRTGGAAGIFMNNPGASGSYNQTVENVHIQDTGIGIWQRHGGSVYVHNVTVYVKADNGVGFLIQNTANNCDANIGVYADNTVFGPGIGVSTNAHGLWVLAGSGLIMTGNQLTSFGETVQIGPPDPLCTAFAISEFNIAHNAMTGFWKSGVFVVGNPAPSTIGVISLKVNANHIVPWSLAPFPSVPEGIIIKGRVAGFIISENHINGTPGSFGIHIFPEVTPSLVHPAVGLVVNNLLNGSGSSTGISSNTAGSGAIEINHNLVTDFTPPYSIAGAEYVQGITLPFAALSSLLQPGSTAYCPDCGFVSAAAPACILNAGGPGAFASKNSVGWTCR